MNDKGTSLQDCVLTPEPSCEGHNLRSQVWGQQTQVSGTWNLQPSDVTRGLEPFPPPGSGPQTRLSVWDSCRSSVGREGSPLWFAKSPQPPRRGPGAACGPGVILPFHRWKNQGCPGNRGAWPRVQSLPPGPAFSATVPSQPPLPTCETLQGQEPSLRAQPGPETSPGPCVLGPAASPPSGRPRSSLSGPHADRPQGPGACRPCPLRLKQRASP